RLESTCASLTRTSGTISRRCERRGVAELNQPGRERGPELRKRTSQSPALKSMIEGRCILTIAGEGRRTSDGKDSVMVRRRYQQGHLFKRGKRWVVRFREM